MQANYILALILSRNPFGAFNISFSRLNFGHVFMGLGLPLTEYCINPITVSTLVCLGFSKPGLYLSGQPRMSRCGSETLSSPYGSNLCRLSPSSSMSSDVLGAVLLAQTRTSHISASLTEHPHPPVNYIWSSLPGITSPHIPLSSGHSQ